MTEFTAAENIQISELNDQVFENLRNLKALTEKFVEAQKVLETDSFAAGAKFPGYILSIRDRFQKFVSIEPKAVVEVERDIGTFQREYALEWQIFLIQAFLEPSIFFKSGQTCSGFEMSQMIGRLTEILEQEMVEETDSVVPDDNLASFEPASDDFLSFPSMHDGTRLPAAQQVAHYRSIRDLQTPPDSPLGPTEVKGMGRSFRQM
jgi:hypothetical protein